MRITRRDMFLTPVLWALLRFSRLRAQEPQQEQQTPQRPKSVFSDEDFVSVELTEEGGSSALISEDNEVVVQFDPKEHRFDWKHAGGLPFYRGGVTTPSALLAFLESERFAEGMAKVLPKGANVAALTEEMRKLGVEGKYEKLDGDKAIKPNTSEGWYLSMIFGATILDKKTAKFVYDPKGISKRNMVLWVGSHPISVWRFPLKSAMIYVDVPFACCNLAIGRMYVFEGPAKPAPPCNCELPTGTDKPVSRKREGKKIVDTFHIISKKTCKDDKEPMCLDYLLSVESEVEVGTQPREGPPREVYVCDPEWSFHPGIIQYPKEIDIAGKNLSGIKRKKIRVDQRILVHFMDIPDPLDVKLRAKAGALRSAIAERIWQEVPVLRTEEVDFLRVDYSLCTDQIRVLWGRKGWFDKKSFFLGVLVGFGLGFTLAWWIKQCKEIINIVKGNGNPPPRPGFYVDGDMYYPLPSRTLRTPTGPVMIAMNEDKWIERQLAFGDIAHVGEQQLRPVSASEIDPNPTVTVRKRDGSIVTRSRTPQSSSSVSPETQPPAKAAPAAPPAKVRTLRDVLEEIRAERRKPQ